MSIRKVNLFTGPLLSLSARARRLRSIKYYSILISLILFAVIFALYLYRAKVIGDIYSVQQEENAIEIAINKETNRQKDLGSILTRVRRMQKALKNDAMYTSRSASFDEIISSIDNKPQLEEVIILNPTDFKLKLAFATPQDLLDFIKMSETPNFGTKLRTYSIGSFKLSVASSSGTVTTLDFSGTFL